MGKVKKKSKTRPNPTTEVVVNDELDVKNEDSIQNIITQLKSGSKEEKENGCNSLSLLVESHCKEIFESGLVRMVAPLMADSDYGVRQTAIGAIRNLSQVSAEVCDKLVQNDILTPLLDTLISRYSGEWKPVKGDEDTETFIHVVNLLWNLCEANTTAVEVLNKDRILETFLCHVRRIEELSPKVSIPLLQFILTVTEDNPSTKDILDPELFRTLYRTQKNEYMQILICGILINSNPNLNHQPDLAATLHTISEILSKSVRDLISKYSSELPIDENEDNIQDSAVISDSNLKTEVINTLLAQQTALEILTNLCCSDDDDDEEEDWIETTTSDEDVSLEDEEVMDQGDQVSTVLPVFVQEAIVSYGLVDKVLKTAILPPSNVLDILSVSSDGKRIIHMIHSLRSKSFLCFNNLVSGLCIQDLTPKDSTSDPTEALFEIWTNLGVLCFQENDNNELDLLESSTSAFRALTQKLCEAKCFLNFAKLTFDDIHVMLKLAQNCNSSNVRINVIHVVGSLGTLAVVETPENDLINDVTKGLSGFLLEMSSRDPEPSVVAEALDKIFDMFAEDVTDALAVEIDLISKLKAVLPGLKVKMNRVKRCHGYYSIVQMAKTNLTRFIKYKSKRPLVSKSLS